MLLTESVNTYKKAEEMVAARICFQMQERKDLIIKYKKLLQNCADKMCGPPFAVFHWHKGIRNGLNVEVGIPVTHFIEADEIQSSLIKEEDVLTITHIGSHKSLKKAYRKIFRWIQEHEIAIQAVTREIYHELNYDNPENNVTEVQIFLRNWNSDYARIFSHIPSKDVPEHVGQDFEEIGARCCSEKPETLIFHPPDCI
ncbi:MAG: GyrI-like domain-containing protein [Candidatus Hodarchaeota archaeon]